MPPGPVGAGQSGLSAPRAIIGLRRQGRRLLPITYTRAQKLVPARRCRRASCRWYGDKTTSSDKPAAGSLNAFIAAAPWPQRTGLRALLAIARRPRGVALLARVAPWDQLARGLLTVGHYDDPQVSRSLGWDAEAVVARGRKLRRAEGRP